MTDQAREQDKLVEAMKQGVTHYKELAERQAVQIASLEDSLRARDASDGGCRSEVQGLRTQLAEAEAVWEQEKLELLRNPNVSPGSSSSPPTGSNSDGRSVVHLERQLRIARTAAVETERASRAAQSDLVDEARKLEEATEAKLSSWQAERAALRGEVEELRQLVDEKEVMAEEERRAARARLEAALAAAAQRSDLAEAAAATAQGESEAARRAASQRRSEVAAEREDFERRLRGVLLMREEGDAVALAERRTLVEAVKAAEALRVQRDELASFDLAAREKAYSALLEAWEGRESALLAQADAHAEALALARGSAAEKEALLVGEMEALRASHSSLVEALESKCECAVSEAAELREELAKLQRAYDEQEDLAVEARRAHERDAAALVAHLRGKAEAEDQTKASMQQERAALVADAKRARELSAARERDLTALNATLTARERELGSSLSTAVDSLDRCTAEREEAVAALLAELETLRARVQREDEAHAQAEEVAADIVLELQGQLEGAEAAKERALAECDGRLAATEAEARRRVESAQQEAAQGRTLAAELDKELAAQRVAATAASAALCAERDALLEQRTRLLAEQAAAAAVHGRDLEAARAQMAEGDERHKRAEAMLAAEQEAARLSAEQLKLPALWQKRQAEMGEVRHQMVSELAMLRQQLADADKRAAMERQGLKAELAVRRDKRSDYEESLREKQSLWATERERLRQEAEATGDLLLLAEERMSTKMAALEDEVELLARINEDEQKRVLERQRFVASERATFERQCEAAQRREERSAATSVAKLKEGSNAVLRMQQLLKRTTQLGADTSAKECEALQLKLRALQEAVSGAKEDARRERAEQQRATAAARQAEEKSREELRVLGSQLQQLRLTSTEQQQQVVQEKQTLLLQIERMREENAAARLEHEAELRRQLHARAQEAHSKEEVLLKHTEAVEQELVTTQRLREEAFQQFSAQAAKLQSGTLILRSMEATREKQSTDERAIARSLMDQLTNHYTELDAVAQRQRETLQSSLNDERAEAAERERELLQQIEDARLATTKQQHQQQPPPLSVQDGVAGSHGATAAHKDAKRAAKLAGENKVLRAEAENLRTQMEAKERSFAVEIERIRSSFERFQQLRSQEQETQLQGDH